MKRQDTVVHTVLVWLIGLVAGVFPFARPAAGQFVVQPMKIVMAPRAGQRARTIIKLQNSEFEVEKAVDVIVTDLTQAEDGVWERIEPGSDFDTSKLSSCRDWITLESNSYIVAPLQSVPVLVTVKVPPGVRGFYCAAIVVTVGAPPGVPGIAVVYKLVVPVLIEIQGRPMRHQVELTDVGMEFREPGGENPATTLVSMSIANNGGTNSILKGLAKVWALSSRGDWRAVTTAEFREVSIIPGVKLKLKSDINRSLPRGKYKVEGWLHVDGRRIKPIEKEIDFAGDPAITKIAIDTPLILKPTNVLIDSVPEATRTRVLSVYNNSNETINITATLSLPDVLQGVAQGDLKGEDLNCAEWVEVVPETFTLHGGGRKNLRIISKMPNPEKMHSNYYALLGLRATYTDGQNAGLTNAHVCVANTKVEDRPGVQPMKLTLGAMEGSNYVIVARFANFGNVHLMPRCIAEVRTPEQRFVKRLLLAGKYSLMLPFEMRDFSAVLDFSEIATGAYRLVATLRYGPDEVIATQIPIRVSGEGEQRFVEIIGQKEFEETIGVAW